MLNSLAHLRRFAGGALVAAALALPSAASADTIRIAFGDIATVESLHFLAAVERAKEKGVDVEMTFFKSEDVAAQAVVSGDADVGVGTPYALIQKVKAPIRVFLQLSTLRFYPIVNAEAYKTWKDLDGQEVAVHARGSGTEAIMKLMAEREGITYSNISYVPGAEVRAGALLQGNIKASIVDSPNRNMLMEKAPGKFIVLPLGEVKASDEALYANTKFLEEHQAAVDILVESILQTWRDVQANPDAVVEWREKYKLLADIPADMAAEIKPYFKDLSDGKALPLNGGGEAAAKDDIAFYSLAGQIEGDPETLDVATFWDVGPVSRAVAKLGAQ
jgi:NitT/TauT family transport system substrate-binding protein